ncbi:HNH endonuclease [Georgenia satyanarayanai]|uniref:HNH endonuclease n=1 Tax=Georgenia satyanarayanai TaxID=860221 RepID=UPI00203E7752|nr:HNH endonuclease [Georgenia satyanarayanai]MCM3662507.1 HNH endonuclease [Georgenia satyanarayanai]
MRLSWKREEVILACDLVASNDWRALPETAPEAQALSALLRDTNQFYPRELRQPNYRSADAVSRKTWDIVTAHPSYAGRRTRGGKLDRVVLQDFLEAPEHMRATAHAIRHVLETGERIPELSPADADFEPEAREGTILLALHSSRERHATLRRRKIEATSAAGSPLACEVCGFSFEEYYGARGTGYIEVHHTVPLHVTGSRTTRLEDLALLCANCHRMIHRGHWITPQELRQVVRVQHSAARAEAGA